MTGRKPGTPPVDSLLLTSVRIATFDGSRALTNASGFFFERDNRLFLATSRHVLVNKPSEHFPDRIEIELHADAVNLTRSVHYSIPLYRNGKSLWRQGRDTAGEIDLAVIEIDRKALPPQVIYRAFTRGHLTTENDPVEIGASLLIVGFPLGFHDTLHHMPVVRHAVIASAYGLRFQGQGNFLTDARTHRGTSGAPVVLRAPARRSRLGDLPWLLLGVHSSRVDMLTRDDEQDEALGLNCAWYADMLVTLTEN